MKRIIKRTIGIAVLTLFVLFSGLVTIMLFPQPLFAHKLEYKKFNVYSDELLDKNIEVILNNAYNLVEQSATVILCESMLGNKNVRWAGSNLQCKNFEYSMNIVFQLQGGLVHLTIAARIFAVWS